MTIDSPPIPPAETEKKSTNKLLWGCLIAVVLALVIFCCLGSLLLLPLFSNFDPLGTNIRQRIEEYLPMDYLEDPSSIPDIEEFLDYQDSSTSEATAQPAPTAKDSPDAVIQTLSTFAINELGISFSYPSGWDIELDPYAATFYHPEDFTYLYVGEDPLDEGAAAEAIANDVIESIRTDAQEGTFEILNSGPYSVSIAEDAYLAVFEWVDQDGYYTWAYDLEIVYDDSNLYFFLSGEDPDEISKYGDLLDTIASSLIQIESTTTETDG